VHSFDYDSDSVACTGSIKERFAPDAGHWTIERGDVLDEAYLSQLGMWDVVYSWGVLHHTGDMWRALVNVTGLVAPSGRLYIALYNDQGSLSRLWLTVKRFYVGSAGWMQKIMNAVFFAAFAGVLFVLDLLRGRNPLRRHDGTARRGMTLYTDVVDWIGGYPFEVARPLDVVAFMRGRGFAVERLIDVGFRQGCNEFVFVRKP
jgi:2-polyprenyl-6-hydroxyphenyl methylase/3-demethylubiquinone-9 3-methyltransferase